MSALTNLRIIVEDLPLQRQESEWNTADREERRETISLYVWLMVYVENLTEPTNKASRNDEFSKFTRSKSIDRNQLCICNKQFRSGN